MRKDLAKAAITRNISRQKVLVQNRSVLEALILRRTRNNEKTVDEYF